MSSTGASKDFAGARVRIIADAIPDQPYFD